MSSAGVCNRVANSGWLIPLILDDRLPQAATVVAVVGLLTLAQLLRFAWRLHVFMNGSVACVSVLSFNTQYFRFGGLCKVPAITALVLLKD
jgi:hypothetical protein